MKTITLGGTNYERLYLKADVFICKNYLVKVKPTILLLGKKDDTKNLIARHKARYYLVGTFLRPKMKLLDFPCGSGYASELFKDFNINYTGVDNDKLTIEYAKRMYGKFGKTDFYQGSFTDPNFQFRPNHYNVIACIEGIEHIKQKYQKTVIGNFYDALVPGGVLVITTPETKKTGKSKRNKYHLCELTKFDFVMLLLEFFPNLEVIIQKDTLHTGEEVSLMYGICHKEE